MMPCHRCEAPTACRRAMLAGEQDVCLYRNEFAAPPQSAMSTDATTPVICPQCGEFTRLGEHFCARSAIANHRRAASPESATPTDPAIDASVEYSLSHARERVASVLRVREPATPPSDPSREWLCLDCGVTLPKGYRETFTVCDDCWTKHGKVGPDPRAELAALQAAVREWDTALWAWDTRHGYLTPRCTCVGAYNGHMEYEDALRARLNVAGRRLRSLVSDAPEGAP